MTRKISSVLLVGTACLSATWASNALASDIAPIGPTIESARQVVPVTVAHAPDLDALRFYALKGETLRVKNEMRRLKTLYPDWQEPKNIFDESRDYESELWKLYALGNADALNQAIAEQQRIYPDYVPSEELVAKAKTLAVRNDIKAAVAQGDWKAVLLFANSDPEVVAPDDLELLWWLAEAYAKLEKFDEARETFEAAFSISRTDDEVLGTIQRAAINLDPAVVESLLQQKRPKPLQAHLASEVEDLIIRGMLLRTAQIGGRIPESLSQPMLNFQQRAESAKKAEDAVLLAWAFYAQNNWAQAEQWFNFALALGSRSKTIEGAILSSIRLGKNEQAAELAGKWLNYSPDIGRLFITIHSTELLKDKPPAMDPRFLQVYAQTTSKLKSGEGAEALGWYAYNTRQPRVAKAWFHEALNWKETETGAFGLALAAKSAGDDVAFTSAVNTFSSRYNRVAALTLPEAPVMASKPATRSKPRRSAAQNLRTRIAAAHKKKQYATCLDLTDQLGRRERLKADDHEMRGWCLLEADRPTEAEQAFAQAVAMGGGGKTASAYGQALSALKSERTDAGLDVANANHLTSAQRQTVNVELLTQRARAAFSNKDYRTTLIALDERSRLATEKRDLLMLRAWSFYHLGATDRAKGLFAALDRQLSSQETRRGLAAANRKSGGLF
jgi:tetratricopeptide (TPR) repeat protein